MVCAHVPCVTLTIQTWSLQFLGLGRPLKNTGSELAEEAGIAQAHTRRGWVRQAERQVDKGRGADRTDGRPQGSGCRHTDRLGSCPLSPRMWDHGLRRPHTYTPAAVRCDQQPGREFVLGGRARAGPDLVWHYRWESRFLAGIVPRGPRSRSPKHEGGLELSEKIGTNSDFPFHSPGGKSAHSHRW